MNETKANPQRASDDMDESAQADYLSFILADELYGVEIGHVEEIRVWEKPTRLPHAPSFVKGVINIRGMIIPIIDLRLRFGIGQACYHPTTVVLILRGTQGGQERLMGMVVDAVSDVVASDMGAVEPIFGASAVTPYVCGLINVEERVMSLLDSQALMNIEQILEGSRT